MLFEQLLCLKWMLLNRSGGVCFPPPAAPGYENLCGHRLRHPAGSPAPQGHHRERTRHRRRHKAIQQVCEAGLRAVHRANHEAGWYCCAKRWDGQTLSLLEHFDTLLTVKHLVLFVPPRWWEYGGHWSDSPARSQPAGGGEWTKCCSYIRRWRHRVSKSCNIERHTASKVKSVLLNPKLSDFYR